MTVQKKYFRDSTAIHALVGMMLGASAAQRCTVQDPMWLPAEWVCTSSCRDSNICFQLDDTCEWMHLRARSHDIQYGVSLTNLDDYALGQSAQMGTLPLFQYGNGSLRLFIGHRSEKDFVYPMSNFRPHHYAHTANPLSHENMLSWHDI